MFCCSMLAIMTMRLNEQHREKNLERQESNKNEIMAQLEGMTDLLLNRPSFDSFCFVSILSVFFIAKWVVSKLTTSNRV